MRYENVKLRNVGAEDVEYKGIFLTQLSDYIWFVRQPLQSGNSEQELERMRKVVYRYPDRPVIYRYIQILYLNGHKQEMSRMLKLFNAFYKEQLTEGKVQFLLQQQELDK